MRASRTKGSSLVEAIIAIAVIVVVLSGIISVYPVLFRLSLGTVDKAQASLLLEEGVEAVKVMRDTNWNGTIGALTYDASYYVSFSGGTWTVTTVPAMIDGLFERTIAVSEVFRDGSDNINVAGTSDPNTRKLTVYVSWWDQGATTTRSISTYVTKLF